MARALISTSPATVEEFGRWLASRLLLAGLDEHGIEWELHQPWLPRPDLADFDAVVCWSYAQFTNNYVYWARRFERRARKLGLAVVNSAEGCDTRHSYNLARWKAAGIPCADFRHFRRFEDIDLEYPLILRVDGRHRGRDMFKVYTAKEAQALIRYRDEAFVNRPPGHVRPPRLDLAIQFVDTADRQGVYRKWRVYVAGDRILPRQLALTREWKANLWTCEVSEESKEEDAQFRAKGIADPTLLIQAARALRSDFIALDFTILPDGRYIFWEGNRHFNMTGDEDYKMDKLHEATGRTAEHRAEDDRLLGTLMGRWVAERVAGCAVRERAA